MATTLENKAKILTELWMDYAYEEHFEEYVRKNDLGLPLAYLISKGIITGNSQTTLIINNSWEMLLEYIANKPCEDTGFTTLDELLDAALS